MQKPLREYSIPIANLKLGRHSYTFEVGKHFFSQFDYSIAQNGELEVKLDLDKQSETLMVLHFHIKGDLFMVCDRCLDDFKFPVEENERILVKLDADQQNDKDDELIFVDPETHQLDLHPFIYDFINLAVPLKTTCDLVDKECNPVMLKHLENEKDKNSDENDPRWDNLKNISLS